jgi:TonB family protein
VYPPEAKAAHIQGAVVLSAIISKTGTVENLQVVSGPKELVTSALDAVKKWTYKPYLLNGEPTEVQTTITVNYSLADPAKAHDQSQNGQDDGIPARRVGGGVSAPIVTHQVPLEYTPEAKADKTAGTVLLNLIVDQNGMPTHVRVIRGIGDGLDEKAIEAVEKYRFKPAMEGGVPVPVQINIEVNFKIV